MCIKNTTNRFGIVAILLHWIMAALIIGLLIIGLYMVDLPISAQKLKFYGWHKECGLLVLMLAVVRLTWRLRNITPTLADLPRWEALAARIVHGIFYFFMFVQPITGWLITSSAGIPASFFGLFTVPTLVSANAVHQALFTEIHQWSAYALIGVFCLHVGGALKHYVIDKDHILQRMLWP